MRLKLSAQIVMLVFWIWAAVHIARAGPPFTTDDPEPPEYRHWETYFASQLAHDSNGWSGTSPQLELDYGAIPNVQLSLTVPVAFDAPSNGKNQFGYGDTELGVKYRFVQETARLPQVGVYPLVDLPTGDATRGLGAGHTQVFFPLWLQKSLGPWTTYGGGGYWLNPGAGNRNWWYAGWLVQRQLASKLTLGLEIFHETAKQEDGMSDTNFNLGTIFDFSTTCHFLFSVGHTIQGRSGFQAYTALEITFGPASPLLQRTSRGRGGTRKRRRWPWASNFLCLPAKWIAISRMGHRPAGPTVCLIW